MSNVKISYRDVKDRAHKFVIEFADANKENADSQTFLNDLFDVFGVNRRRVASFERKSGSGRVDLLWSGLLLVEMKSTGKSLEKAYDQSLGYFDGLKDEELPRYVLCCDLNEFRLYDLDEHKEYSFVLEDLSDNLHLFDFMTGREIEDITNIDLNVKAAELLGELYDALENSGYKGNDLQTFMIRILFILFAEDTGIFNRHQFTLLMRDFTQESGIDTDMFLNKLFEALNQKQDERVSNLIDEINGFSYIGSFLFRERISMPSFTSNMRERLLECCHFNWKTISPDIFGSLFQSIMNKSSRKQLGSHYTSEENILKAIDPLFMNDLRKSLEEIKLIKLAEERADRLIMLLEKIRDISVLDPACGSGNFLVVSFRELRRIEQDAMHELYYEIHYVVPEVRLNNFYGIEIDEWPSKIALVALLLTKHQMDREFSKKFGLNSPQFSVRDHANIYHDNALICDWEEIVSKDELKYIVGNPPFLGAIGRSIEQNRVQDIVLGGVERSKTLDYVCNWFYKSALFIKGTRIECALISTKVITTGRQSGILWGELFKIGMIINFAHKRFWWSNDARNKAKITCVIVGFSNFHRKEKYLYDQMKSTDELVCERANNINSMLVDAHSTMLTSRKTHINKSLRVVSGTNPNENHGLRMNHDEMIKLITNNPETKRWIRETADSVSTISGNRMYCLWMEDANTKDVRDMMKISEVKRRLIEVTEFRECCSSASINRLAETPWILGRDKNVNNEEYLIIPITTSARRKYIPMTFIRNEVLCLSGAMTVLSANVYEFGILNSEMNMNWIRAVGGRQGGSCAYNLSYVFNNFIWPTTTESQKENISGLAQKILDERQVEFDANEKTSLVDLYDPDLMPQNLRKAHKALDKAVDLLYSTKGFKNSSERVAHLFELYAVAIETI